MRQLLQHPVLTTHLRRPALGRHGAKIVAFLCAWELIALAPGTPLITLSEAAHRWPPFGFALLSLLGHHWFLEKVALDAAVAVSGCA